MVIESSEFLDGVITNGDVVERKPEKVRKRMWHCALHARYHDSPLDCNKGCDARRREAESRGWQPWGEEEVYQTLVIFRDAEFDMNVLKAD